MCFFIIVLLTEIHGTCNSKNKILSIASGTSFGRCITYCRRSINITSNPYELIALKEPNFVQTQYPSVQQQYPISSDEWQKLISLINSKSFQTLNDTIGCPDCADGGAEWIQINWLKKNKQVTFEYGKVIQGFEGLINELRSLRDKYVNNL
ncbi:unnamed protein product [Adineta steineri]|uniref:Uncharacterized protein n=1 Tax=Adineta steineri TaxID=433720 RepID=A0A815N2Y6_9BILA|nr:unnamed protein product [Adineta steineri]CAF1429370.1 unnamed protein product [Adineta steineri]CAF1461394.1 unnamed protein product [Adineta steineri]CAF3529834.1 unnamed protein product [Adineta steineri]CAF3922624.1 unnamed protein product [Adineta steineri]